MAHRHLGVYCLGAGWQDGLAAPTQNRTLDSYAAVLVSRGGGMMQFAGSPPVTLKGPVLLWLFPGVQHTYAPNHRGWQERWVLFNGFGARSYEQLGLLNRSRPVVELSADQTDVTGMVAAIVR